MSVERSVLGALLLDPSGFDEVSDRITLEDFEDDECRAVWVAMCSVAMRRIPLDIVTVGEQMGRMDTCAELVRETPSAANVLAYADQVRDRSVLRRLRERAHQIARMEYEGTAAEVVDRAQALLADLTQRGGTMTDIRGVIGDWLNTLDDRVNHGGGMRGVPTPWQSFNRRTDGLCAGDLIIVAGRPSMGKSAFAFQIAGHAAVQGKRVALFSLEMSTTQVMDRLVACEGRVSYEGIRCGRFENDDEAWARVAAATSRLKDARLYIDDTSGLTVTEIRSKARRLKGLDLVVVDYLQLIRTAVRRDRHDLDVGEITVGLKGLAKELQCPVVLLSQLSRKVEDRSNKRPLPSDLRDSGSIEQDADLILFPYRPEVYDEQPRNAGVVELITSKFRNGATGVDMLTWLPMFQRFEEMDAESSKIYRSAPPVRARGME